MNSEPKRPDPCLDCKFSEWNQTRKSWCRECFIPTWLRDVTYVPDTPEHDVVLWAAAKWEGKRA